MSRPRTDRWASLLTAIRSRFVWIPALVIAVLVVGYWVVPRRAVEIVSVDRELGWRISAAPPRRKIVWKPAELVDAPAGDASARDSLIRPQLAEYGSVLYFTLRSPDRGADIYRSRLRDGKWQPAEPVAALNTAADDIGPVFQPGERQLYFYSNRPGGYGGFDIYGSQRNDEGGWSDPTNLGPHVNSPAHEYDPAVTADGRRLFFSSNRTPTMSRQMAGDELGQPGDRWDSTLRADLGLPTFDLYVAGRESPQEDWSPALPLAGINRGDTNEGSPYISSAGVFLYFSSDRPQRAGEPRNFDLYRVRMAGNETGTPQNLGQGVNSPANEIEPALSEEGFRLVFSRDMSGPSGSGADHRYQLYSSLATEVEESIFWDSANLAALAKIVKLLWWWVVLALLLAALVAALIWYLRQVSLRRLPLPAFLLTALLLHILFGFASFFIYFGEDIVAKLKKDVQEATAVALSSNELHQSHKPGPESYEKVADLQHVETVKPTELDRKVVEKPNVPVTPQVPAPNVPAKLTRDLQPPRPDATLPKSTTKLSGGPELARQRLAVQEMLREKVEVEQTQAQRAAAQAKPLDLEVAMNRRRAQPEMTDVPRVRRRTVDPRMELAQEQIDAERAADTPLHTPLDQQTVELERAARAAAQPEATETVKTESMTAPDQSPAAANQPQRLALEVDRRQPAPQTDAPQLQRRAISADATMRLARADTSVDRIAEQPVETQTDQQPTDLSRTAHAAAEPASQPNVATEQVQAPTDSESPGATPRGVAVQMDRQAAESSSAEAPRLLPRAMRDDGAMRLARADTAVDPVVQAANDAGATSPSSETAEPQAMARVSATAADAPAAAGAGDVQTEQLAAPAAPAAGEAVPRSAAVDVARSAAAAAGSEAAPRLLTPSANNSLNGVRLAKADIAALRGAEAAIPTSPVDSGSGQTSLSRATGAAVTPAAAAAVSTEALAQPAAQAGGSPAPAVAPVAVGRQAMNGPSAPEIAASAAGTAGETTPVRLGASGVESDRQVAQASFETPSGPTADAPLLNQRGSASAEQPAAGGGPIETAVLSAPAAGGAGAPSTPRAIGVSVARRAGNSAPAASGAPALQVALVDRQVGLGPADAASEKIADILSAAGPKSGSVTANLARAGQGRAASATGTVVIETVATEGPAVAVAGEGRSSSPRGVGVEVTRRGSAGKSLPTDSLQLAMVGTDFGSPRLTGQIGDAAPAFDAVTPDSGEVTGRIGRANRGLALATPVAAAIAAETVGDAVQAGDGSPGPASVAGIPVGLKRATGPMLELPVPTGGKIGGLHNPDNHRLVLGSLDSEANNAPPSFSPITSRITRRPARAPKTLFAEDNIGLAAMMKMRQVDEEEKRDLVEAFGGDDDTLEMIQAGLAWIVRQQHDDGRWSLDKFADNKASGRGKTKSDTAGTALALLPLLGDGNTPDNGPHRDAVRKGIDWLLDQQKDDGDLYLGGNNNGHMYSHGMATIVLCEAYGMTHDPQLREPAQRAINFIVAAQHQEGGWRYRPGEPGDTSVVGWQVMALKSAQMAELDVPPQTLDKARQFVQRVQHSGGEFKYQRGGQGSPAMTAEGLLCHQYLGASRGDSRLQEGAKYLLQHLPQPGKDTSYCWYYGNQVMYHMQGEYWQQWNEAMKETLRNTQRRDGAVAGSWDPKDKWEESGGRLYSTSLRVLMLEVYFRHLPLYQVLEQ